MVRFVEAMADAMALRDHNAAMKEVRHEPEASPEAEAALVRLVEAMAEKAALRDHTAEMKAREQAARRPTDD